MRMFAKVMVVGLAVAVVAACNQSMDTATTPSAVPGVGATSAAGGGGNGAPSGSHYNLNIIGVPQDKTADMKGNTGGRIFVPLEGRTNIYLREGDYQVLDANGTDADGAKFQLPDPDPENDRAGDLAYSVWIRPVAGKGNISFQTCYTDTLTGEDWCYAGVSVQNLTKTNKFVDVSRDLLQVCADIDPTSGVNLQLVPLFDPIGSEYWWEVTNDGMHLTQLRFYPIATTPIGGDCQGSRTSR